MFMLRRTQTCIEKGGEIRKLPESEVIAHFAQKSGALISVQTRQCLAVPNAESFNAG